MAFPGHGDAPARSDTQRELGLPVANLKSRYDDIIAALDMIFLGF